MAKILLLQNFHGELYSFMSIVAYLKGRHDCQIEIIDENRTGLNEKLNSFKPDVVGLLVLTKDHFWAIDLVQYIKSVNSKALVLLGGAHPTFYTKIIESEDVDAICIGEGEKPVLELLDRIDNSQDFLDIPSLWVKRGERIYKNEPGIPLKADEIPIAEVSAYKGMPNLRFMRRFAVMASRGCPYGCTFCSNYQLRKMYGTSFFRMRKVEHVIKEIELAKEYRQIEEVKFDDDILNADDNWSNEFFMQYKQRIQLPFQCHSRFEFITEEKTTQLKEAGCYLVSCGIESGSEHIRNKILGKGLTDESVKQAARILKKKKMKFYTFNMFGMPEENYENALKTLNLNLSIKPDFVWSAMFQPYPGTKYFNQEAENEIINPCFNRFIANCRYDKDWRRIQRLYNIFRIILKFPALKYLLPILTKLPLDRFYDKLSKWSYDVFFDPVAADRL